MEKKVRNEIHTRTIFAHDEGVKWLEKIKHSLASGNIMSCKATNKFLQARRIYIHYTQEFQKSYRLPCIK